MEPIRKVQSGDMTPDKAIMMRKNKVGPEQAPHIIHADTRGPAGYPTHTHGLWKVGLPEMIINANAFGARDNAYVINSIFLGLWQDEDKFKKVQRGEDTEIVLGEGQPDQVIVRIRSVSGNFSAVCWAYPTKHEDMKFSQLYVDGDDYVLDDNYYKGPGRLEEAEGG